MATNDSRLPRAGAAPAGPLPAAARLELALVGGRLKHSMQGILQNIGAFGGLLEESACDRLTERERSLLRRVRGGADRGLQVLHGVAALVDVKLAQVAPRECHLAALVRSCIARLTPPGRDVHWDLDLPPAVTTDPALLEFALAQLIDNALKFTGGTERPRIAVRGRIAAEAFTIVVSDNGVGFDASHADRLFTPFERLHLESEFPGAGLGLAIVKAVADRLDGSVAIEGAEGRGSTVTLVLARLAPRAEAAPPAPCDRRRVLLADDDPLSLLTLTQLLERDGHAVTAVASGQEAVAALHPAAGFDCVVTDLLMPGVDGLQVAAHARSLSPRPRIILLSGGQLPTREGDLPPTDAVLAKPIRAATLRAALQEGA